MPVSDADKPMPTSIEVRSIDYVPDGERHGGLASQFTLWLAANLQITAIVTGALAVVFGGDVFWSLVALLFGQLIGGAVMALHAAQGPQLGLPQMISCRVQFGIYGAVIPIVAVCLSMSLSASWQIAYGPYVADYSRYLPRDTSTARVFAAVGLGSVIDSQISMTFGVLAAALAGKQFEHHEVAYIVSLGSTGAVAGLLYFSIAFGKVTVTSLNAYGSFMSMATMVSGFRRGLRISVRHRLFYIVSMVGVSVLLAIRSRWPLRPVEYDRHLDLPDRDPGSDPLSFHGVLHGTTGRAGGRCGYLLDCRPARAGRSVLRIRSRLAAARAAAAHPARLTTPARINFAATMDGDTMHAMHYVAPLGEKDEYISRTMKQIVPFLQER